MTQKNIWIGIVILIIAIAGYFLYAKQQNQQQLESAQNPANQTTNNSSVTLSLKDTQELESIAFAAVEQKKNGQWEKKIDILRVDKSLNAVEGGWWAQDRWQWAAWRQPGGNWNVLVSLDGFDCKELESLPTQYESFFHELMYSPSGEKYCYSHTSSANQNTSTKIAYSGEWTQAQFPQNDYRHSINIMLPTTWEFNCCGDTGGFSAHSIYPRSFAGNFETNPHITIYDFVLSGCPDGEYINCEMDQLQRVTPNQYMTSLVNHLDKNGEAAGLESLNKTGVTKLTNFTANAVVYSGMSRSTQPVDLYLIQSSKGVVGVAFQQPQSFDPSFKTEFLNRLVTNNSSYENSQ